MNPIVGIAVSVVVLLNIAALLWLLVGVRRRPGESSTSSQTTGHVWDEDLREWDNPLPRWWLWLFVLTVMFGLGYLVVYPGLGNYAGTAHWTSARQLQEQNTQAEAVLAKTFAPFERRTALELSKSPDAIRVGRNLFVNNCAACHGSDARGAPGFPNLTDRDWLWGGKPEDIIKSIAEGRTSVMPPWRDALGGDSGVEDVLRYVFSLSGRELPAGDLENGRDKFKTICAACHGADGRGNRLLGAPNLTDQIWLNGGSIAAVRQTIAYGRQAEMPAHLQRFGATRVNLLAAYVISLGGADTQQTTASAGQSR